MVASKCVRHACPPRPHHLQRHLQPRSQAPLTCLSSLRPCSEWEESVVMAAPSITTCRWCEPTLCAAPEAQAVPRPRLMSWLWQRQLLLLQPITTTTTIRCRTTTCFRRRGNWRAPCGAVVRAAKKLQIDGITFIHTQLNVPYALTARPRTAGLTRSGLTCA